MTVRREVTVELPVGGQMAEQLAGRALQEIGAKSIVQVGPGALAAQMGFSFRSFGENLAVAIAETAPGRSVVKLMSASIVPTTMIDWGKSNQNVKRFEEALRRLAGTPLLPPA